jgi:hypothetical protein
VQGGDKKAKRRVLAPRYVNIGGHEVPIDIPLLVAGFILTFLNAQIANNLPIDPNSLKVIGELLILVGAIFFIFGRIELKK